MPVESRILGFVLVESGILGFGIWHTAQGIRNPTNDSDSTTSFPGLFPLKKMGPWERGCGVPLTKNPQSSTWNPDSTVWNPESKTVLDSLIWGD